MLAEASRKLGGRVTREASLPGLNQWARVRDYRLQQIEKLQNVEVFRESELTADQAVETGADHIAVATGAKWRRDGFGPTALSGISNLNAASQIYTPDDIMAGNIPQAPALIYDDDHYYMGSVIAELLANQGVPVTLVTPEDKISNWGGYTYDRWRAQTRLMELDVELKVSQSLLSFDGTQAELSCTYTGRKMTLKAEALVLATARTPNDKLFHQLAEKKTQNPNLKTVKRIGDCDAPAIIAAAVYSGHRYARELEEEVDLDNPLKYDRVEF